MEQEVLKRRVKIISKGTVKPLLPPPSLPKTYSLSLLDQVFPAAHVPLLLFYTPTSQGRVDLNGLKTSLSQTLDQFYPLAGRFLDDSTISCNHQGLPYIETEISCHLSDVLTSPHKQKLLTEFLPPRELVPLAIQVNVFLCGGVVIGCYMLHKVNDAASLGTFLNYWSAHACKQFKDLVQPDFEARIKAFPPLRSRAEPLIWSDPPPSQSNAITTVVKSFVFNSDSLRKLRGRARSEVVPNPTRFEAVGGLVWEQTLSALRILGSQVEHTTISITVNMRPRMQSPLPRGSMGNLVTDGLAQADKNSRQQLQELVQEIHSALSQTNQKITNIYQGDDPEVIWSVRKSELQSIKEHKVGGIFRLVSWCKLGFDEADFGFGKPVWIVPTDGNITPAISHYIILTDYSHPVSGEGIEAWLFLEEKEMQILETNPQFLAFASPNW